MVCHPKAGRQPEAQQRPAGRRIFAFMGGPAIVQGRSQHQHSEQSRHGADAGLRGSCPEGGGRSQRGRRRQTRPVAAGLPADSAGQHQERQRGGDG